MYMCIYEYMYCVYIHTSTYIHRCISKNHGSVRKRLDDCGVQWVNSKNPPTDASRDLRCFWTRSDHRSTVVFSEAAV